MHFMVLRDSNLWLNFVIKLIFSRAGASGADPGFSKKSGERNFINIRYILDDSCKQNMFIFSNQYRGVLVQIIMINYTVLKGCYIIF